MLATARSGRLLAWLVVAAAANSAAPSRRLASAGSATAHGGASLFCWTIAKSESYELGLAVSLHKSRLGLFQCEEAVVYSDGKKHNVILTDNFPVRIVNFSLNVVIGGQWHTALNSRVFYGAWSAVLLDGDFLRCRWTVKVDIDTVFIPERLRPALKEYNDEGPNGTYVNNCQYGMHGPIEIFSRNAVMVWGLGRDKCRAEGFHYDQKDLWIDQCMWGLLGPRRVSLYKILLEEHCDPPDNWKKCQDSQIAAFHPFKNAKVYLRCLQGAKSAERWTVKVESDAEAPEPLPSPETSPLVAKLADLRSLLLARPSLDAMPEEDDSAGQQQEPLLGQEGPRPVNAVEASVLEPGRTVILDGQEAVLESQGEGGQWRVKRSDGSTVTVGADKLQASNERQKELVREASELERQVQEAKDRSANLKSERQQLETAYADPSVQQFLQSKARKVYDQPGSETFKYVLPSSELGGGGSRYSISDGLSLLASGARDPRHPGVKGLLVYGMAAVPLCCTAACLMRVVLRLRPCLLFIHVYFAITCSCIALLALLVRADPMSAFAVHDAAAYEFAQLWIGVLLVVYGALLAIAFVLARNQENQESRLRALQIVLLLPVASNYFFLVWRPAMADSLPQLGQVLVTLTSPATAQWLWSLPYLLAAGFFLAVLHVEQLLWRQAPNGSHHEDAFTLRVSKDGQLGGVQALATMIGWSGIEGKGV